MVPCPWLTEVADYAKAHPDADLGLHLTLTSEWKNYRWGPAAPKDQVPSLIASDGNFYPDVPPVASHATPADVEREIRAQVELAIRMGIRPTHCDMHMGTLAAKPEFYAALVKVAHEFKLPFLAVRVADPGAEENALDARAKRYRLRFGCHLRPKRSSGTMDPIVCNCSQLPQAGASRLDRASRLRRCIDRNVISSVACAPGFFHCCSVKHVILVAGRSARP